MVNSTNMEDTWMTPIIQVLNIGASPFNEFVFHQMVTVAQDVMTVYLQDKRTGLSFRSTSVVPAKKISNAKVRLFFLSNVAKFWS